MSFLRASSKKKQLCGLMRLHLADVNPESRKEVTFEDGKKLTAVNKSRHTTLKNLELVTGSKVENLGHKISLGYVARK